MQQPGRGVAMAQQARQVEAGGRGDVFADPDPEGGDEGTLVATMLATMMTVVGRGLKD